MISYLLVSAVSLLVGLLIGDAERAKYREELERKEYEASLSIPGWRRNFSAN